MGALQTVQWKAAAAAFQAAYGADFEVSLATGLARAESKDWAPDAGNEVTDFVAVLVGSVLVGKNASGSTLDVAPLLNRTWVVLAKKNGWKEGESAPAAPSKAASNIVVILGALVLLAEIAAIAYVVYRATLIVTQALAHLAAEQELMRAHRDAMRVVDAHTKREELAGKPLPYDAGELAVLEALRGAQDAALQTNVAAVNASEGSGATEIGGGVLLGLAAAAGLLYLVWGRK